jgi:hypothetical protein
MQKWEYLFMLYRYSNTENKYNFSIVGDYSVDDDGQQPLQMMNRLGEQGWELVAAQHESLQAGTLTFKRPLQSPKPN